MPSGPEAHKPSGGPVPTTAFTSLQPWLKISSLGFQRSALLLNLGEAPFFSVIHSQERTKNWYCLVLEAQVMRSAAQWVLTENLLMFNL